MTKLAGFIVFGALASAVVYLAPAFSSLKGDTRNPGSTDHHDAAKLCDLLEGVAPGEKIPATVSGIYRSGFGLETLYDPDRPLCRLDVQPYTALEFAKAMQGQTPLARIVQSDGKAFVTLKGVLWGPGIVGPDDPSVLPAVAYFRRVENRRYGWNGSSRTKFVVEEVVACSAVPEGLPRAELTSIRPRSPIPEVLQAALLRYPQAALAVGITGEVVVQVTVERGRVKQAEVKRGDRILALDTVANIKTWIFKDDVNTTFTTTLTYAVELREVGSDTNPRVELHLPLSAKIIGPLNAW
jgi:hypothetical protein